MTSSRLLTKVVISIFIAGCDSGTNETRAPSATRPAEQPPKNDAVVSQDPTIQSMKDASLALQQEMTRLSGSAEKLPKDSSNRSMQLSDSGPADAIRESVTKLASAAKILDDNVKATQEYSNASVKLGADGTMEIPALKTLVTDIRSYNQKILDDSDKLTSVQGSGSATLEEFTKKTEQYTAETDALEKRIDTEIKPIADGFAAKTTQLDEMAEITHMRNFKPEEAAALLKNTEELLGTLGNQVNIVFNFKLGLLRAQTTLNAPSASVAALKSALKAFESSRDSVASSLAKVQSQKDQMGSAIASFRQLVDGVKSANDQLGGIFEQIRTGSANTIIQEISKLEGARNIVAELIASESRASVKESLETVKGILDQSISNLSKIAENLVSAMASANQTLEKQRQLAATQSRILTLQDEYLATIENEQKRISEQLGKKDRYDAVKAILGGLEAWADKAKAVSDRNASLRDQRFPFPQEMFRRLLDLRDDSVYLRDNIKEANRSINKNLRFLRTADARRVDSGVAMVTVRRGQIWLQMETLSENNVRILDDMRHIYTPSGIVKDLRLKSISNSSKLMVEFTEVVGAKQSLVLLFGDAKDISSGWPSVTVSETYARLNQIAMDEAGRSAITWQDLDKRIYLQIFDAMGRSVSRVSVQDSSPNKNSCSAPGDVALSRTGNLGVFSCLSGSVTVGGTNLYRRFTKDGQWIDPQLIDGTFRARFKQKYPNAFPTVSLVVAAAADGSYFADGRRFSASGGEFDAMNDAYALGVVGYFPDYSLQDDSDFIYTDNEVSGLQVSQSYTLLNYDRGSNYWSYSNWGNAWQRNGTINFVGDVTIKMIGVETHYFKNLKAPTTLGINQVLNSKTVFRKWTYGYLPPSNSLMMVPYEYSSVRTQNGRTVWNDNLTSWISFPYTEQSICGQKVIKSEQKEMLRKGEEIVSCNGRYKLKLMESGVLAHFLDNSIIWSSGEARGSSLNIYDTGEPSKRYKLRLVGDDGLAFTLLGPVGDRDLYQALWVSDDGYVLWKTQEVVPLYMNDAFTARVAK